MKQKSVLYYYYLPFFYLYLYYYTTIFSIPYYYISPSYIRTALTQNNMCSDFSLLLLIIIKNKK
jgi:hypothetical protein